MNEETRRDIRQRAKGAVTKDDLIRAIFDSFQSQAIDVREVSLEEMKAALLEAALAARDGGPVAA